MCSQRSLWAFVVLTFAGPAQAARARSLGEGLAIAWCAVLVSGTAVAATTLCVDPCSHTLLRFDDPLTGHNKVRKTAFYKIKKVGTLTKCAEKCLAAAFTAEGDCWSFMWSFKGCTLFASRKQPGELSTATKFHRRNTLYNRRGGCGDCRVPTTTTTTTLDKLGGGGGGGFAAMPGNGGTTTTTTTTTTCAACATNVLLGFAEGQVGFHQMRSDKLARFSRKLGRAIATPALCAHECTVFPAPCRSFLYNQAQASCTLFRTEQSSGLKTTKKMHRRFSFYQRIQCGGCRSTTTTTTKFSDGFAAMPGNGGTATTTTTTTATATATTASTTTITTPTTATTTATATTITTATTTTTVTATPVANTTSTTTTLCSAFMAPTGGKVRDEALLFSKLGVQGDPEAASAEACGAFCEATKGCRAYAYKSAERVPVCLVSRLDSGNGGKIASSWTHRKFDFYDRDMGCTVPIATARYTLQGNGYWSKGYKKTQYNSSSISECANHCSLFAAGCAAFFRSESTGNCYTYAVRPARKLWTAIAGFEAFYDGAASARATTTTTTPFVQEQPNLYVYVADDLPAGEHGIAYEGNSHVNTPNVDVFARNAIDFSRMYTPTAMCSPARAALLTGMHPVRNGLFMNHGKIKANVRTLPSYLRALDYRVVLSGKLHVKPVEQFDFGTHVRAPMDVGLHQLTLREFLNLEGYRAAHQVAWVPPKPWFIFRGSPYPHTDVDSKRQMTMDSDAFFTSFASPQFHLPAKLPRMNHTGFMLLTLYNGIQLMDRDFGTFLKDTGHNHFRHAKKSVTIFLSDHGPAVNPMYAKWSCYEAGLRIPFYLQHQGLGIEMQSGRVDFLASFTDLAPTFIELGGGSTVSGAMDGKSLLPALRSQLGVGGTGEGSGFGTNTTEGTGHHQYIFGVHTSRAVRCVLGAYPIRSVVERRWKYIQNFNQGGQRAFEIRSNLIDQYGNASGLTIMQEIERQYQDQGRPVCI